MMMAAYPTPAPNAIRRRDKKSMMELRSSTSSCSSSSTMSMTRNRTAGRTRAAASRTTEYSGGVVSARRRKKKRRTAWCAAEGEEDEKKSVTTTVAICWREAVHVRGLRGGGGGGGKGRGQGVLCSASASASADFGGIGKNNTEEGGRSEEEKRKSDERVASVRATLFYMCTICVALPIFALMIIIAPFVFMLDRQRRDVYGQLNTFWAMLSTALFFNVDVRGRENLPPPSESVVYVANHASYLVR